MQIANLRLTSSGIVFVDKHGRGLPLSQALQKIIGRFYSYFLDFELLILNSLNWIPIHFIRNNIFRLAGVKIGSGSTIHTGARFFQPAKITIGRGSIVGYRAFIDGRAPVNIGDHVDIASEVMIYNSEHDIHSPDFHAIEAPVTIGDYVFVGPRALIMPGVTIGRGAIVAGGAVVTKDVADFSIVGGVPAKEIGQRQQQDLNYRLGRPKLFQ